MKNMMRRTRFAQAEIPLNLRGRVGDNRHHVIILSSSMASKKFKVQLSEEANSRAARRVLLNAETLRSLKLSTGDVVAVTKTIGSPAFAVGVVWPSIEQSADCK